MTPIEISSAADPYAIEFELDGELRYSAILTATCSLAAMLIAWGRFPQYKLSTTTTCVHNVSHVAIDAITGGIIVVKTQESQLIPPFLAEEPNRVFNDRWKIEEKL
jgi:hypothetical protein